MKLESWHQGKLDVTDIPPPNDRFSKLMYRMSLSQAFEVTLNMVILVNVVLVLIEMVEEVSLCREEIEDKYGDLFIITNYVFIGIYFVEALIKVTIYFVACLFDCLSVN